MITRDAELARGAFEAWEDGTLRSIAERQVHPDVEFYDAPEMPDAQVMCGRDAALARMDSTWSCSAASRYRCARWSRARTGCSCAWRLRPGRRQRRDDRVGGLLRDALPRGLLLEIRNYFDRETALEEAGVDPSVEAR